MKETTLFGLRVAGYFVIAICLLLEGALLMFSGFPYWVPIRGHISLIGCLWAITCIAAVYETIRPRPMLVFLAACLLFLVSAVTMWFYSSDEKSLVWFLYLHSLELAIIAAALALWLLQIKARKAP